jgi:hypothetical protein
MTLGSVAAVVLAASAAVFVLAVLTTAARHRRMDERHAKLRELRRRVEFPDGRGVPMPHLPVERQGRFVRDRVVTSQRIRWSKAAAGD